MRNYIFFLLSVGFVLFSLFPTAYELSHRDNLPSVRSFELVHNFPTDYNFYLSRIRQGLEGNLTVHEKYTSEPHEGSFIQVFYVVLGWAGRWSRVPWERTGDIYHVARIVLGITLLLVIAEFVKSTCQDLRVAFWSIFAFLLAVMASSWPKLVAVFGNDVVLATWSNISHWRFGAYMPWWSVMDSLQRITFIPHVVAGQILLLVLLLKISDRQVLAKGGNWLFLGALGLVLGTIFPPGLLFLYATVSAQTALEFIFLGRKTSRKAVHSWFVQVVFPRFFICSIAFPALLYVQFMVSFYPWKRLAEFDIVRPLPFDVWEYAKAMGSVLPLGVVGGLVAFIKKERGMILPVAWVIAWGLLLFIFRFIPQQSPLRFSEMLPHVALAVLTVYLFFEIGRLRHLGYVGKMMLVILIGTGLFHMYSSLLWQRDFIDHKIRSQYPLVPTGSYVMYPLKDFLAAMRVLQDTTSRDTVILSETTAGNYIPVYAGNTVYVGHANTVQAEAKEALVKRFFAGTIPPADARLWLLRDNIHVVFFGPQEKEDGGVIELSRVYPFLEAVYRNTYVTVYRANP